MNRPKGSAYFRWGLVLAAIGVLHLYWSLYVNPGASGDWIGFSWSFADWWWIVSLVPAGISVAKREPGRWLSLGLMALVFIALCCDRLLLIFSRIKI